MQVSWHSEASRSLWFCEFKTSLVLQSSKTARDRDLLFCFERDFQLHNDKMNLQLLKSIQTMPFSPSLKNKTKPTTFRCTGFCLFFGMELGHCHFLKSMLFGNIFLFCYSELRQISKSSILILFAWSTWLMQWKVIFKFLNSNFISQLNRIQLCIRNSHYKSLYIPLYKEQGISNLLTCQISSIKKQTRKQLHTTGRPFFKVGGCTPEKWSGKGPVQQLNKIQSNPTSAT